MSNGSDQPIISVYTSCKNSAKYLKETLDSIFMQTFQHFEVVLVDGTSTDGTLEILRTYEKEKRLRWISEPDKDANEGFRKALKMAKGKYIMCMPVSDGYLNPDWFRHCVNVLEKDREVSLVWGMVQFMDESGGLKHVESPELFHENNIQKNQFFPFWAATHFHVYEMTYCVRTEVYKKCFPINDSEDILDGKNPYMQFDFNFNTKGYLPYFIPVVASFARIHRDSRNYTLVEEIKEAVDIYFQNTRAYLCNVLKNKVVHTFMDGNSQPIRAIGMDELKDLRKQINIHKYFTPVNLFFWRCDEKKNFYKRLKKKQKFWKRIYWKWLLITGQL